MHLTTNAYSVGVVVSVLLLRWGRAEEDGTTCQSVFSTHSSKISATKITCGDITNVFWLLVTIVTIDYSC